MLLFRWRSRFQWSTVKRSQSRSVMRSQSRSQRRSVLNFSYSIFLFVKYINKFHKVFVFSRLWKCLYTKKTVSQHSCDRDEMELSLCFHICIQSKSDLTVDCRPSKIQLKLQRSDKDGKTGEENYFDNLIQFILSL